MGRTCREVHEWIEEEVEEKIIEWEERQEKRCRDEPCNWWLACLNKVVCWFVLVLVKVVRTIVVTVGKWVIRFVCETLNFILDVVAWVINMVLALPVLGGLIRVILNWIVEIAWRVIGLPELIGSLLGLRLRKKMYFSVIIPVIDGAPIATPAQIQPQVDYVISTYDALCNIDMRFTGFCTSRVKMPEAARNPVCSIAGFFQDLWLAGSYFQLAVNLCKFKSNWRRLVGAGGEIFVFVVPEVLPSNTVGCSMAGSQDYVVIEPGSGVDTAAHEIGHACLLGHHDGDSSNLMGPYGPVGSPTLTLWQVAVVRSSRHCVYL